MHVFKLIGPGDHSHKGKLYKKGDIIRSSVDLTKVFKNKFERVHLDTPVAVEDPAPKKTSKPSLGTAVKNTLAKEHGLKVFKRGKSYHVYEGATPINEKPLAKAEVTPFIKAWLEE